MSSHISKTMCKKLPLCFSLSLLHTHTHTLRELFECFSWDKAASCVSSQSTVSLKTPIRLWGRCGGRGRHPVLGPAPDPPSGDACLRVPGRSAASTPAQVNELRSPQLCRCSRAGVLLGGRGKVWDEPPACWGGLGWQGPKSEPVNTWKQM